MKILFLVGASGSGKTTIAKRLCDTDERFNFINSFTDRQMREKNEYGHTFVNTSYMDVLLERSDVVAKTDINGHRYCSLESQFDNNKINIYVVDANGINDTIEYFPMADIMSILIRRKEVYVDCIREGRDVCVPSRDDVDFCIDNDYKVESAVNVIKVLTGLNLFSKSSRKVKTVKDKIKDVEQQQRYLEYIKESLLVELWHMNYQPYVNLLKFLEEKLNEEFDYDITIRADSEPDVHDEDIFFNVLIEYPKDDAKDMYWEDINHLIEKATTYSYNYCQEHDYDDLSMNLRISERYIGEPYE